MSFAPILISVYNRPNHFLKCINSLSECEGASSSILYITSDFPKSKKDTNSVLKVREIIKNIKGFKKVISVFTETNTNGKVINDTNREILDKFGVIIYSEDDNIFSKQFLNYMNEGLRKFKNNPNVFSISGYNYPIKLKNTNKEIYFWTGFSAWGYATWKEKYFKMKSLMTPKEKGIYYTKKFMSSYFNIKKLYNISPHYIPALTHILKKNKIYEDSFVCLYLFNENMLTVFPKITYVRNIGNDGSGLHCVGLKDDLYLKQKLNNNFDPIYLDEQISRDSYIYRVLKNHFQISWKRKIKTIYELIRYIK